MAHNWKWYVENDDLLGCYKRYEQAKSNWKDHWWNTVETIYNNSTEWAKGYFLDTVQKILVFIQDVVKVVKPKVKKEIEKINSCYWIRLIGESGMILYDKIGTTTNKIVENRFDQILKKQYADGLEKIAKYEVLGSWDCGELAPEGMESYLRAMLIKKYNGKNFVKNDRFFIGTVFEEPTEEEMNGWAMAYLG